MEDYLLVFTEKFRILNKKDLSIRLFNSMLEIKLFHLITISFKDFWFTKKGKMIIFPL